MDKFTSAYITTALWSSTDNSRDDGGNPLDDNYGPEDIAPETQTKMQEDCADFQASNAEDLTGIDSAQAGHDFWLTRNRHGAGFWDRGLGDVGKRLTEMSHGYGGVDLYIGDDGLIHA